VIDETVIDLAVVRVRRTTDAYVVEQRVRAKWETVTEQKVRPSKARERKLISQARTLATSWKPV